MRWYRPFSVGLVLYTLFVIVWGAFVRASGSGAGCGAHWPVCNGEVLHRPESVETMIELTHRLTSGLCIPLVIVLVWAAFKRFPKGDVVRKAAVGGLFFMVIEALIGAAIVLQELTGTNDSMLRAFVMGFHLINTFVLMACLFLAAWWARRPAVRGSFPLVRGQGLVPWILLPCVLGMFYVGASGGVAALGDTLFPATSLADGIRQDLDPDAHTLLRLRAFHPFGAMITAGILIGAAGIISALRRHPLVWKAAGALTVVVIVQVIFGWANLLALAPIWMQLTHLFLAQLVWMGLVLLGAVALEVGAARSATATDDLGRA